MNRVIPLFLLTAAVISALSCWPATAQTALESRLRQLEAENRAILERLERTEAENRRLADEVADLRSSAAAARTDEMAEGIERLVQATGGDAVRWSNLVRTNRPITIYGLVRLDAYYQTARTDNVIAPFWVISEDGADARSNDDVFALDARSTRIGVSVDAGRIGAADVTGVIEVDFASFVGGGPEAREVLRLRLGYIDLDFGSVALRLGQDWEVVSPLIPMSNPESIMQNVGNLADRRPMAQFIWRGGSDDDIAFELRAAAGLTGAFDNQDLDRGVTVLGTTERDGFDAGVPQGQIRFGVSIPSWVEGQTIRLGGWGALGALETDTAFGGERDFTTWLAGVDWVVPIVVDLEFRGELWIGEALSDFFGGIGQSINTTTGEEILSRGGWVELAWRATDLLELGAGASLDDPANGDLPSGARSRNWAVWAAARLHWSDTLVSGLDVFYWETSWLDQSPGNMVRIGLFTQLDF